MTEETRIAEDTVAEDSGAQDVTAPTEDTVQPAPAAAEDSPAEETTVPSEPEEMEPVQAESADSATAEAVSAPAEPAVQQPETDSAASSGGDEGNEESDDDKNVVYLSVGQKVEGVVKRITDFGAFVDIGAGRDGLIHISELAVGRVSKVSDVVKEGQEVTCWIKKLDRKRNRISLTLVSPETKTIKDLNDGEVVQGKVTKIMPYGAFIDIGVGTDGLLHIREMSTGYVNRPEDVLKTGEETEVRIIGIDRRRRRIDLSLKGLRDEPEAEQAGLEVMSTAEGEDAVEDPYADVEVLSPMELAFKKAMEAEGIEVDVKKAAKRTKQRRRKGRAIQDEIINRTLETMRD